MKLWIAILATIAFLVGCAGRDAGAGTSSIASGAGSPAPTDEQVRAAYSMFRYRLICPDDDNCDKLHWQRQPWIPAVTSTECVPARRSGVLRCRFMVHEGIYLGVNLHPCRGLFRREGEEWRMLSILGRCFGTPVRP